MNTTALVKAPRASELPSFGDELTEFLPWIAAIVVLGPITVLTLMLWAPFLLLFALIVAPIVVAGLLGLGAAILAMPFLLIRHRHQRPSGALKLSPALASQRHHCRGRTVSVGAMSVEDVASFQAARRRLFAVAYNVLGNVAEADDVVQDAWTRWQGTDRDKVRDPAAFLAHDHPAPGFQRCRFRSRSSRDVRRNLAPRTGRQRS